MPDTTPTNGQRLRAAEWQGYTKAKLEDILGEITELKLEVKGLNKRMAHLQVKVAGIAGSVTAILIILKELFLK